MATYEQMKTQFLNLNQKLAFECIDKITPPSGKTARDVFIKDLDDRRANPRIINQEDANLCGPACFMFSIAREDPDEYGKFVLGLAMRGEGKIGGFTARPPNAPKVNIVSSRIAPVDWVALASVRDDGGASQMTSVGTGAGGLTFPIAVRGWFDKTGMFKETYNITSLVLSHSLDELLRMNTLPAGYACLLLRTRIVDPSKSANPVGPDHWVLMVDSSGNPDRGIEIKLPSGLPVKPTPLGSEIVTNHDTERFSRPPEIDEAKRKKREELEAGTLDFSVYTWGEILGINERHIRSGKPPLTVKKFLGDYFGFVLAIKR
jgi:hypothetical protein